MNTQAMMSGRLEKHLKGLIRYNGKVMTNKDFYEAVQADGYTTIDHHIESNNKSVYSLKRPTDNAFYDIPKMVYDMLIKQS